MQHQQEIHTINKAAPPSYAEAMGYTSTPTVSETQTHSNAQTYGPQSLGAQSYGTQMPYPVPNYQTQSNLSSNHIGNAQPPYNPAFPVSGYSQQQQPPTVSQYVVHTEVIGPRKTFRRCCTTRFIIALIFFLLVIYVVKVIVSRAMFVHR